MKNDDFLDRAIDQVSRELTDGAPRQGFAGRVRGRIEAPARAARWRWQLAVGAAAAVALAVWLALPPPTVTPITSSWPQAADRVLPVSPAGVARAHAPEPVREPVQRAGRPQPRRLDVRIPVDLEDTPQIAAISEPVDLSLKPIEIAELTIAPLEPEKESR